MQLATITEFGASAAGYTLVLQDMVRREASFRRGAFSIGDEVLRLATLGAVDLVQVEYFDSFYPLSEIAESSAQTHGRSIGVRAIRPKPAPQERGRTAQTAVPDLLDEKGPVRLVHIDEAIERDPVRPLAAVIYARFSPLASLSVPHPDLPVVRQVSDFLRQDVACWHRAMQHARRATGVEQAPTPKVCVLEGLDAVDLVLLVRFQRLEQVAGITEMLRDLTMEIWRPEPALLARVDALAGAGKATPENWRRCPLLRDTLTVIGAPIRKRNEAAGGQAWPVGGQDSGWVLEEYQDGGLPVADHMMLLSHLTVRPGRDPDLPGTGRSAGSVSTGLYVFGQKDQLFALDCTGRAGDQPFRPQPWRLEDLFRCISDLSGAKAEAVAMNGSGASPGVTSDTEVAVAMPLFSSPRRDLTLLDGLAGRLTEARSWNLNKDQGGWTRIWLDGAKKVGIPYPLTSGFVNLLASVLASLDDDPLALVDLLRPLHTVIEHVRKVDHLEHDGMRTLRDFFGALLSMASATGHRDHPMKSPGGGRAFDGFMGYHAARGAFCGYVGSLLAAVPGLEGHLLVLDSPAGVPAMQRSYLDLHRVVVALIAMYHPLHWVFGHEVGHIAAASFRLNPSYSPPAPPEGAERARTAA